MSGRGNRTKLQNSHIRVKPYRSESDRTHHATNISSSPCRHRQHLEPCIPLQEFPEADRPSSKPLSTVKQMDPNRRNPVSIPRRSIDSLGKRHLRLITRQHCPRGFCCRQLPAFLPIWARLLQLTSIPYLPHAPHSQSSQA